MFDRRANGQQLTCLTVTDEFTKEGLAIDVDGRIRSPRVIEVLSRLVSERGAPTVLRSDNGPEFVSRALLGWILGQGIDIALIEPGKPWQNGVAESFNGKTGLSPAKAIENLPTEVARLMLEDSQHSIDVIAGEVGFGTRDRMRRAFVRKFGQAPLEIRHDAHAVLMFVHARLSHELIEVDEKLLDGIEVRAIRRQKDW